MFIQKILGLSLVGILAITNSAWADSSAASAPATQSSSSNILQTLGKNVTATYQAWLTGPTVYGIDGGDANGTGTNLNILHYGIVGYKLGSKWKVSATQVFSQTIDEVPSAIVDPFVGTDPYLTFSNSSILKNERYGFNLSGYIRYYAPFSHATKAKVRAASAKDNGGGQVRLYVNPSKTWLDGALSFTAQSLLQYRIASRSDQARILANRSANREDMIFVFDPILAYAFNSKVEGYVEYAMVMYHNTHKTSNSWGKWKDNDVVSLGANLQLTKQLLLNPYTETPPRMKEAKNTKLGLIAAYTFL